MRAKITARRNVYRARRRVLLVGELSGATWSEPSTGVETFGIQLRTLNSAPGTPESFFIELDRDAAARLVDAWAARLGRAKP